jgi:hypothetical protein
VSSYEQDRPSGRHQVNIGHLVMGIAFLGIVGVWALVQTDTVTGDDIRWLLPIPWVVAGLVGLTATAITGPRRHAVRQTGWAGGEPPPVEATPFESTTFESTTADLPTYPSSGSRPETDLDPDESR